MNQKELTAELARLASESVRREVELAKLEAEVIALREMYNKRQPCYEHAWNATWRDDVTGKWYKNCVTCGVKVEV